MSVHQTTAGLQHCIVMSPQDLRYNSLALIAFRHSCRHLVKFLLLLNPLFSVYAFRKFFFWPVDYSPLFD